MNLLGAVPPPEILEPLERIFRQALVRGSPRPYGVVVEDPAGVWRATLAGLSNESRSAAVIVASSAEALALGARWSVGGGLALPPSTAGMTEALTAAREFAGRRSTWMTDAVVLKDLGGDPDTLRASLTPGELWDRMVGHRKTVEYLEALATVLGCHALIDDRPSLLISGSSAQKVRRAWTKVQNRPEWADDQTFHVSPAATGETEVADRKTPSGSWAVAEIPSGREVGRWAFDDEVGDDNPGMTLIFEAGGEWVLDDGAGGRSTVPEIVDPSRMTKSGSPVVRIPGWLTRDLGRPGSPAAVLVTAAAREASRLGIVLWVPGVTQRTLPHVMRLEGRIWVDGPAVPDSRRIE